MDLSGGSVGSAELAGSQNQRAMLYSLSLATESTADVLAQLGICSSRNSSRAASGTVTERFLRGASVTVPEATTAEETTAEATTAEATTADTVTADAERTERGETPVAGKPWYCYLLISTTGNTYIGATVDPDRRLRQHNKELVGGARRTGQAVASGERWDRVCKVSGFPDNHAALQFEWRWKRLSCKKVYARKTPIERRIAGLQELLALDRPTSRAAPYSSYGGGGPRVGWE
jgi:structure-specific endonuclease subunit SLX1